MDTNRHILWNWLQPPAHPGSSWTDRGTERAGEDVGRKTDDRKESS